MPERFNNNRVVPPNSRQSWGLKFCPLLGRIVSGNSKYRIVTMGLKVSSVIGRYQLSKVCVKGSTLIFFFTTRIYLFFTYRSINNFSLKVIKSDKKSRVH